MTRDLDKDWDRLAQVIGCNRSSQEHAPNSLLQPSYCGSTPGDDFWFLLLSQDHKFDGNIDTNFENF